MRFFRAQLHHPRLREKNRAALREIVDRIAVVDESSPSVGSPRAKLILKDTHRQSVKRSHRVEPPPTLELEPAEEDSQQTTTYKSMRIARLQRLLHRDRDMQFRSKVPPWQRRWFRAACNGDAAEMATVAAEHAGAGAWKDLFTGYTGVHWAAKKGNREMLAVALRAGGDLSSRSHGGYTPLHLAALAGFHDFYHHLVSLGADVEIMSNSGDTPASLLVRTSMSRDSSVDGTLQRTQSIVGPRSTSPETPARSRTASLPSNTMGARLRKFFGLPTTHAGPLTHNNSSPAVLCDADQLTGALASPQPGEPLFVFDEPAATASTPAPITPTRANTLTRVPSLVRGLSLLRSARKSHMSQSLSSSSDQ